MSGQDILTVNGHALKAVGIGNICIELPNGTMHTKALHKDAIHAPEMAFTLISISQSDDANSSVTFTKAMCTIKDAKGHIMATIPQANGLHHLATPTNEKKSRHANIAAGKMSISEVHQRLGHISHTTIKHAISTGKITGIDLDMDSKPEFCEPCAKAKSIWQPFLKKSAT